MINMALLPRPWSSDRPRNPRYRPIITAKIERVSRSKKHGWRSVIHVGEFPMATSHHGTRAEAEQWAEPMLATYASVHYTQV